MLGKGQMMPEKRRFPAVMQPVSVATMQPTAGPLDASYGKGPGARAGVEREYVAVSVALRGRDGGAAAEVGDDRAFTLRSSKGGGDKPHVLAPAVAVDIYNGRIDGDVTATITSAQSRQNGSGAQVLAPAVAFNIYPIAGQGAKLKATEADTANAVTVTEHAKATDRGTRIVQSVPNVLAPTLTASNDPSRSPQSTEITQQVAAVQAASSIVRRLTPVECCRLQGFPDNWNAEGVDAAGKHIPMADSNRYRQLGNAVTVNVANWLATNVAKVYASAQGADDGQP